MVQIFIAHSKKDLWLIDQVHTHLKMISVDPYIAGLEDPTPLSLPEKIKNAIKSSAALFLFLTPNVANQKSTRDIMNWEIATAYTMNKPVYVFKEKGVDVPMMIKHITVYYTYEVSKDSLNEMGKRMKQIASALKNNTDKVKTAATIIAILLGVFILVTLVSSSK